MHLSDRLDIPDNSENIMKSRGPMDIMTDDIHKPRIRPEGRLYKDRSQHGTGVAEIFGDFSIAGMSKPIYFGKAKTKPKNFMEENKKSVKELNETLQSLKLNLTPTSVQKRPLTPEKYKHVESKVGQLIRSNSQQNLAKSGRSKSALNLKTSNETPKTERIAALPARPTTAVVKEEHRTTPKMEKKTAHRPRSASIPKVEVMHKPGTLPKYLIDRKIAWQEGTKKPEVPDCPPGHRLVGSTEKQETLAMLKSAESEILSKLNTLPIRTDTPFLKRKKAELEGKLIEVEEAQRIFSRGKVFVKTD